MEKEEYVEEITFIIHCINGEKSLIDTFLLKQKRK